MNKILVLGATGRIGLEVVRAFSQAGWAVVAQARAHKDRQSLPKINGVTWLSADLEADERIVEEAKGARYVFYGLNPKKYTTKAWRAESLPMLATGIRMTEQLGARLLFPGNVYNFGKDMPARLLPDTVHCASTDKGRIRIEMEQAIAAAVANGRITATILRAGDYWGSGSGTMLDLVMAKSLSNGKATLLYREQAVTPWAYLPDFAQCFLRIVEVMDNKRDAVVPTLDRHHFAGHALSGRDWLIGLSEVAREADHIRADQSLTVSFFPWWLMRLFAPVVPICQSLVEMCYLWRTTHELDNTSLVGLIGEEPHTSFPEALWRSLGQDTPVVSLT